MIKRWGRAGLMKIRILIAIVSIALLIFTSCWGPKKSPEEENVLLTRVKAEIDVLKAKKKNNPCFINFLDKCMTSYATCAKAWEQKIQATSEIRRQDMDLTLSVMQSFAALNIQRASNCFKS